MIGLYALQTPPAIKETVRRQSVDWGRTVGGIQKETPANGGQEEIESSTIAVRGRTSAGGKTTPEDQSVKSPAEGTVHERVQTAAFSEYVFSRKAAELISFLEALKPNLQNPEGAAIMASFRESLEQIWHVAGRLPREKAIIISAVEEAVRNRKWRELTVGQVEVLRQILSRAEVARPNLDTAFAAIHRSQIDIYPSAADDFDDETDSDRAE